MFDSSMNPPDVSEALARLHRIRVCLLCAVSGALFLITGGLVVGQLGVDGLSALGNALLALGFSALVMALLAGLVSLRQRCPRCGRKFNVPDSPEYFLRRIHPLKVTCPHCDIALYEGQRRTEGPSNKAG